MLIQYLNTELYLSHVLTNETLDAIYSMKHKQYVVYEMQSLQTIALWSLQTCFLHLTHDNCVFHPYFMGRLHTSSFFSGQVLEFLLELLSTSLSSPFAALGTFQLLIYTARVLEQGPKKEVSDSLF